MSGLTHENNTARVVESLDYPNLSNAVGERERFLLAPDHMIDGNRIWPLARRQFLATAYQEELRSFSLADNELSAVFHYTRPIPANPDKKHFAMVVIHGEKSLLDQGYLIPAAEVHNFGRVKSTFLPSPRYPYWTGPMVDTVAWTNSVRNNLAIIANILREDPRAQNVRASMRKDGSLRLLVQGFDLESLTSLEAEYQHFRGIRLDFELPALESSRKADTVGVINAKDRLRKLASRSGFKVHVQADTKRGEIRVQALQVDELFFLRAVMDDPDYYHGWPIVFSVVSGGAMPGRIEAGDK